MRLPRHTTAGRTEVGTEGGLYRDRPFWALQSEVNERAIRKLWSDPRLPADHAAYFTPQSDALELPRLYIFDMVDQHHPGWTDMRAYVAVPTEGHPGGTRILMGRAY